MISSFDKSWHVEPKQNPQALTQNIITSSSSYPGNNIYRLTFPFDSSAFHDASKSSLLNLSLSEVRSYWTFYMSISLFSTMFGSRGNLSSVSEESKASTSDDDTAPPTRFLYDSTALVILYSKSTQEFGKMNLMQ